MKRPAYLRSMTKAEFMAETHEVPSLMTTTANNSSHYSEDPKFSQRRPL